MEPEPKPFFDDSSFDAGSVAQADWVRQRPIYSDGDCCLTFGQNFESLVLRLRVQERVITHPVSILGSFGDNKSVIFLEMEGAATTCLGIYPDKAKFPIRSGAGHGVQILLDLETFDNAHLGISEDGLKIQVADHNEYPLLDLNGFTISPGTAMMVKIRPVLYDITPAALDNFNDAERQCVDSDGPAVQNILNGTELPYSLSNCLLAAALEQAYAECPGIHPQNRQGLMDAAGVTLNCLNWHIERIGVWKELSSGVTCLDACRRQENKIFTSESRFPNKMFAKSDDFYLVVRKLWWSCLPTKNRFGPKRPLLDVEYPNLCKFYDTFVYRNLNVSSALNDTSYFLDVTMAAFLARLNMSTAELASFEKEILTYSEKNLIKINAYIEKVFAVQYMTDQESSTTLQPSHWSTAVTNHVSSCR
jgi:hypothetical protein